MNSFINGSFFPHCFTKFIILEICFFHRGCSVYHWYFFLSSIFFSIGLSLSNTERIFLANMSFVGAIPELAFKLGVMSYMDKNFCNSLFMISIPLIFLIALTSTNLSAIPLTLGGKVEMLSVQLNGFYKNFQNLLK